MNKDKSKENNKKKMTSKQIVAIIGVVLLVLLYVITLITAIFDRSGSGRLFQASLAATLVIPLLVWIYTWLYGRLTHKHTFADFDIGGAEAPADKSEAEEK